MTMTPRFVPMDGVTDDDLDRWRDLAARAAEPNVFFEPELLVPAVRALARPGAVRLLVVADEDGRWTACAPVHRVASWGRLRLPCTAIWAHPFCGLEAPLVDAADPVPALTALLGAMRRPTAGLFAAFTQIPAGPLRQALEVAAGGSGIEVASYERAGLRRRPEFTYLDTMKGKRRQELARHRRRLEEAHGPVAVVDLARDPEGVETFLAMEASGWKGREGSALATDPAHADFFREACAGLRALGRLELITLTAGGRPVAMKCNMIAGDRIFGVKQAFDESMGTYSPGRLLDIDTMRGFHDRPNLALLDTIASADNATVNAMWPDRLRMSTVLVPARGPLGATAGALLRRAMRRRSDPVERPARPAPAERPARGEHLAGARVPA